MVPTTARMGAGTRFKAKRDGTADPTAAVDQQGAGGPTPREGPEQTPDGGGGNHRGNEQADIGSDASKCAHHLDDHNGTVFD